VVYETASRGQRIVQRETGSYWTVIVSGIVANIRSWLVGRNATRVTREANFSVAWETVWWWKRGDALEGTWAYQEGRSSCELGCSPR
jgi:hypothetical protein